MEVAVQSLMILAALMSSDLDFSAVSLSTVPSQFIGTWSPALEDCSSGDNDGIVVIQSNHISHWESAGPIRAVVIRGRHEIALINELAGEGDTRLATQRYVLSTSEDRLYARNIPGRQGVLYRCPTREPRPNSSFKPNPLRGSA